MGEYKGIGVVYIIGAFLLWFIREAVKDMFFGWVGNKFITIASEKDMTWFLDLIFGYGIPVLLLGVGVVLLFYKPSEQKIKSKQVERDVWLLHAVHYIAFGSSEFVEIPFEEVQLTAGHQAQDEIRQKAFDGSLPVWGIIGSGGLFKPIPKEYWEHHYLKALIFAINDPEGFCTKGNGLESDHTIYNSLMTSKAKVEELWPVVNT